MGTKLTGTELARLVAKHRDDVLPLGLGNGPGDDTDAAQQLLGVREAHRALHSPASPYVHSIPLIVVLLFPLS